MKKKTRFSSILIFLCVSLVLQAQQQLFTNLSHYQQSIENVAAGSTITAVQAVYRRNWMPLSYSPELLLLHAEGRFLKSKEHWDLKISTFATGIIKQTELKGGFSHHLVRENEQQLNVGLRAGFLRSVLNTETLKAKSPEELEGLAFVTNSFRPTFDIGFYYRYKHFSISLSSSNFYSIEQASVKNLYRVLSDNQMLLLWNFTSSNKTFQPALSFRSAQGMPLLGSLSLQYDTKKTLALALGCRSNLSLFCNLQLQFNNQFAVLYSLDYSTQTSPMAGTGNELGFTYQLK